MKGLSLNDLVQELCIPISQITIDGNVVYLNFKGNNIGTCLTNGTNISEPSLNWTKIYELHKKQLTSLILQMYNTKEADLVITAKPDRTLELKVKGTQMYLPSVKYTYLVSGDWELERADL